MQTRLTSSNTHTPVTPLHCSPFCHMDQKAEQPFRARYILAFDWSKESIFFSGSVSKLGPSLLRSHRHMAFPERDRRRAAAARKERVWGERRREARREWGIFFLSLFAPPLPPPSILSLPRLSLSSLRLSTSCSASFGQLFIFLATFFATSNFLTCRIYLLLFRR